MKTGCSNRSFRTSGFGFLSDLGFRVSDFGLNRRGANFGVEHRHAKEENPQPTGSFKARGTTIAISRAKELGLMRADFSSQPRSHGG